MSPLQTNLNHMVQHKENKPLILPLLVLKIAEKVNLEMIEFRRKEHLMQGGRARGGVVSWMMLTTIMFLLSQSNLHREIVDQAMQEGVDFAARGI